ncbi:MAG: Crp/Fnr family transcriptional regulator [Chitinophagales bacterium]|nr:Crp/Fnr family transcriptional regulator [Chitinophagales bacterium]
MDKDNIIGAQINPLMAYFDQVIPLNAEEKTYVAKSFQPRLYRKRQYVLQEGDVCKHFNFVVRGCLRMYKIDEKGNMHILQFASEDWWITDMGSFYHKEPSQLNIDVLEDTMVLQINYENLTGLYDKAPKFNRIFRVLIENSHIALQNRLLQNISISAEERYLSFLKAYSHLTNRIPQTQIAAYLGITPEFVSRIRNGLSKK